MDQIGYSIIKPIGGYFELENTGHGGNFPQVEGVLLNTGRNAFEFILASIKGIIKVYIPYYTCEVILEPFKKLQIDIAYYHLNTSLEIAEDISLADGEYLLYTNYFGVMDEYVQYLASNYGDKLILDNAQALYAKRIPEIKTFYSPRKYVGIPDGGVAFIDEAINLSSYSIDESDDRMSHLYLRLEQGAQAGYAEFRKNSEKLKKLPILNMSFKTRRMIENIDFERIKTERRNNFQTLHKALESTNKFVIPELGTFECPMVYPYWTDDTELKLRLIKEQVFVATYWPNVLDWTSADMIEHELAKKLLAIPCDQRYGEEDMNVIIQLICK